MAANTLPIFARLADVQWGAADGDGGAAGPLKTQNTAMDGTGTVLTVFTADATNGGIVRGIRFRPAGTNIATVARIFVNNGLTNGTIANNVLFDELSLASTTASASQGLPLYEWVPTGGIIHLPAGYKLLVTLGTTVVAGYCISTYGGKF